MNRKKNSQLKKNIFILFAGADGDFLQLYDRCNLSAGVLIVGSRFRIVIFFPLHPWNCRLSWGVGSHNRSEFSEILRSVGAELGFKQAAMRSGAFWNSWEQYIAYQRRWRCVGIDGPGSNYGIGLGPNSNSIVFFFVCVWSKRVFNS